MLMRSGAGLAAAALLLTLLQPVEPARAAEPKWLSRFAGDFLEANQVTRGKGVRIALLSDGVDPGLGTLDGALEKGRDLVGTPKPERILGTLMASLLVGGGPTADAPFGVRGVVSKAKLLPVRVYATEDERGGAHWQLKNQWSETLAKGIRYAADQGAEVIAVEPYSTNSVFESTDAEQLLAAVAHARSKDALIVAAGAPEAARVYPHAVPGVLGVGAVKENGKRSKYSTSSSAIALSAPGFRTPTTGPDGRTWTFWGNPAALTWVAAAAALVRSEHPKLTATQVAQALTSSARHPKGRYDHELGFGYVNAIGALNAARKLSGETVPPVAAKAGVVKDRAHFGERRGTVRAVPYDPAVLGGFGALALAGLGAVVFAGWMLVRRRRWKRLPAVPEVPEAPAVAEDGAAAPESAGADSS
ncbi:S8 family serine peptidase [Actinomadura sp. 21ATH]|uniref:S8 family serine peptidase n=1 Tax=Actinomadura sp. 21ATH TaxID=1735444 RepID=UPI0035BFD475